VTLRRVTSLELYSKDAKGDFVTDPHSILPRCGKHFSQVWNIHVLMILGGQKYIQQ